MHQPPVKVFVYCDNCGCRMSVTRNMQLKRNVCQDCRDMMELEKKRMRSAWGCSGTFHLIYDPDESWTPCGGWFSRVEIIESITIFTPGTRFDAKGTLYTITDDYKLERVG